MLKLPHYRQILRPILVYGALKLPHYRQILRPILVCGAVACLILGAMGWRYASSAAAQSSAGHWVKVTRQQFQQPLVLQGVVVPAQTIDVLAPTDGTIVKIHAKTGDIVMKGQRLLEIDASEARSQLYEAEAATIRGEHEASTMNESSNSELRAAIRRNALQRGTAAQLDQRTAETRALFEHGVVARSELESVENEQRNAHDQLASSEEEMAAIRKKFSPEMLRATKLELLIKRNKLDSLKKKLNQLVVVAPISGILLAPPAGDASRGGESKDFRQGSPVTGRDVLYSIGELKATFVRMSVNEGDLGKIQTGQAAQIRLKSLPDTSLDGTVEYVSVLAKRNGSGGERSGGGGGSEFDALVRINETSSALTKDSGNKVYFGASAEISVVRELNGVAFELPISAIRWDSANRPFAWVSEKDNDSANGPFAWIFAWLREKNKVHKVRRSLEIIEMAADRAIARTGVNEHEEVWVEGAVAAESASASASAAASSRPLAWLRDLFKVTNDDDS